MLWSLSFVLLALCAIYVTKLLIDVIRYERRKRQMPPGPPGLPVIGNLLQMTKSPFLRCAEWAEQYGPIFSLHLGGQPVVVLSDFTVAADLIDRRSSIYSDRHRLIMANLMSKGLVLPVAPYGDAWRDMRKAAHEGFNAHVVKSYRKIQEESAYRLLVTWLGNSHEREWERDIKSAEARNRQDVVQFSEDLGHRTALAAMPGSFLVDVFPFLEHIPTFMNPWKIKGEKWYQLDTRVLLGLLDEVRSRMDSGVARKSFCADLIELEQHGGLTKAQAAWLCGTMYVAGVETTSATLQVFVLAMVLYPEVMRRAQQEIDAVVGRNHPPNFDDAGNLPYVDALIREVMRWRPVGPLGVPKRSSQDDVYEGYLIPKGTIVMQNIWAMHHDPKYFDEPEVFKPERYINSDGKLKDPIPDTHGYSHGTFGSGRRVCVGKDLAQQSLFINIATLLWGASMSHFVDECGTPVVPSPNDLLDEGVVVRPIPFPCIFEPRFDNVSAVVNAVVEEN